MNDIQTREHIEFLVDIFYKEVLKDEVISHFFTDVIALNWDEHIPIMYDFWETMVLDAGKYGRNAMLKHIELHRKSPLEPRHFDRWLALWENAVIQNFAGANATKALQRAQQIGELMKYKLIEQL